MIDLEVADYLRSDSTLDGLISSSGSNSKIYPNQVAAKHAIDSLPYIIYNVANEGTTDENWREITITFNCISDDYLTARNIRNRVVALLDVEDQIRNSITSDTYIYYAAKCVGGVVFKDPDVDVYHNAATIEFKYAKI